MNKTFLPTVMKVLVVFYLISFGLGLFSNLFPIDVDKWIFTHLWCLTLSVMIYMLLGFIKLIDIDRLIKKIIQDEILSIYQVLFILQIIISFNSRSLILIMKKDFNNLGSGFFLFMCISPTILIILRSFFERLIKIEKMLEEEKEIKNEGLSEIRELRIQELMEQKDDK